MTAHLFFCDHFHIPGCHFDTLPAAEQRQQDDDPFAWGHASHQPYVPLEWPTGDQHAGAYPQSGRRLRQPYDPIHLAPLQFGDDLIRHPGRLPAVHDQADDPRCVVRRTIAA